MIVQFLDPNSTKAMHLGHLYEAILGNALAALLRGSARMSGAIALSAISAAAFARRWRVSKRWAPKDAGANRRKARPHGRPALCAICRTLLCRHPEEADNEDPIRRETGIVGDRADDFMRLYQTGDGEARALWRKIRDWVVDGQLATLTRLQVDFDTIQYGSDYDR